MILVSRTESGKKTKIIPKKSTHFIGCKSVRVCENWVGWSNMFPENGTCNGIAHLLVYFKLLHNFDIYDNLHNFTAYDHHMAGWI